MQITDLKWLKSTTTGPLAKIIDKVERDEAILPTEGLWLYENADIGTLGSLANFVRHRLHGDTVYFNRNFHIEPTNICVFDCKFCSYSRLLKQKDEGWEHSAEEMLDMVKAYDDQDVTEVHIVGGVHPKMNLKFFGELIRDIRSHRPDLHVKAFTAVEYDYMFRKAKVTREEGFKYLISCGLQSLPGGGAEIFAPHIRKQICEDKVDAAGWLDIHETAHRLGLPSNATMLYGHIESYADRVDHMEQLRQLQARTGGFNTFIPLKFRNGNNQMSHVAEATLVEDLRNYAVARIYMQNVPHLKAYWPMIGRDTARLSLDFGVNDLDGTIDDTTKIYSMAGAEEQNPVMTTDELVTLIHDADLQAIERDTLYGHRKHFPLPSAIVS